MAYDESRGRTILYGGSVFDGKVSTSYYDTWEWDREVGPWSGNNERASGALNGNDLSRVER